MASLSENVIEARLARIKILIVDDHHYIRKVVRTMLDGIGVRHMQEASDGMAALEALPKFEPDVVILDWDMPLIDGLEFVRMVRTPGSPNPDVPIIMLTAHNEFWRVKEALRYGVHEFLTKPVSTKNLRDRIVAVLQPRPMITVQDQYVPAPRGVGRIGRPLRFGHRNKNRAPPQNHLGKIHWTLERRGALHVCDELPAASFDHLVSDGEHGRWYGEA